MVAYLSRFTEWIPARYVVKSRVRGRLYPFPINLDTDTTVGMRIVSHDREPGDPRDGQRELPDQRAAGQLGPALPCRHDASSGVDPCGQSRSASAGSILPVLGPSYPTPGNLPSTGYAGSVKPGVEGWPGTTRLSASVSSSGVHS
jgi:hypothetical protein